MRKLKKFAQTEETHSSTRHGVVVGHDRQAHLRVLRFLVLDQWIVSFFQRKPLCCSICRRSSNQVCSQCERPICMRHSTVKRQMTLVCPNCLSSKRKAPAS